MQARTVALDMLLAVTEEKKPSHTVAAREFAKYPELEKKERAFAKRLFNGTIERMLTLDFLINRYSRTKTDKMKPVIRGILRLGMYQLYFTDVPPSAVCNEAVKLAKKRGFTGLSGFVNGVLRAAVREPVNLSGELCGLPAQKALSLLYSMPEWLCASFLAWYGKERTERIFSAFLEPAGLTVRVNRSKCDVKALKERFLQAGIAVRDGSFVPEALHLSGIDAVTGLPGFAEGDFAVQDESSMLPVLCAGIGAGAYVIDCCAAPGGKAVHAADVLCAAEGAASGREGADRQSEAALPRRGMVSARDVSDYKLLKIRENAVRCGFDNIEALLFDATKLRDEDVGRADVVLADLPCSGLGIIGKKPDIKYNMTPEGLKELAALQREILQKAAQYVKPGGVLIYSTCTVNPAENEENFRWIAEELGLAPESLNAFLPEKLHSDTTKCGYLQLLPETGKCDGFFVSRFRRKGGESCK